MSLEVWKFPLSLNDNQLLKLPRRNRPLYVAAQDSQPVLYSLVDTETANDLVDIVIHVYGTGQSIPVGKILEPLGVVSTHTGALWWHIFKEPSERHLLFY